jgi:hypothetical protein
MNHNRSGHSSKNALSFLQHVPECALPTRSSKKQTREGGEPMTRNTIAIAVEIAILLGVLFAVEWLAHVLTSTRDMFLPAALILAIYVALRMAISARARRASDTSRSN